ncbi:hypothetical protein [Nocardia fluminea]|uniref:hypothetical protein n=1 Tax=Nocardia fluminea TaxID=134984 RepID=UPI000C70C5F9|nr:hypothetical protein [Nocardia fluminea]
MHQDEVIERAIETFGSPDLLSSNTGIDRVHGSLLEVDLDAARTILEAVPPAVVKTRFATARYESEDEIAGYAMKRLGVPARI